MRAHIYSQPAATFATLVGWQVNKVTHFNSLIVYKNDVYYLNCINSYEYVGMQMMNS